MAIETNCLYYGDNLEILRKYIPDNSVDLIYLDPPFNSKANYNILFKEPTGELSQAQIAAFEDTWHWGEDSEHTFQNVVDNAPINVVQALSAFRKIIHENDMMAYLAMMCVRLVELKKVLKDTGSIYLHCDPTASHYLKILMDSIFGAVNYRNEIIWKRTSAHNTTSRRLGSITDTILFYTKMDKYYFDSPRQSHSEEYVNKFYRFTEADGRKYRLHLIERNQALGPRPNLIYEYNGYTPVYGWMMEKHKLEELDKQGKLKWSTNGRPLRKIYLDEVAHQLIGNLWDDILPIQAQAQERLGYPTQKPLALLERIIQASSNEGDVVLDPFCGCGTAIVAAQKLNRKWIGIDITHLAISTMKWRLEKMFPGIKYKVTGEPADLTGARELAKQNKYQFQWWALSLIGGRPYGDKKKGADRGIDGYCYFMDEKDKVKTAIISVKGGGTSVKDIRDLSGVLDREKAEIGIFLTLEEPTKPMQVEATTKGFYRSPLGKDYARIQILTIADLLNGKKPDIPPWISPVANPGVSKKEGKQIVMESISPGDKYKVDSIKML